ncbi:MAG: hypothetical protein HY877_03175 [Deltaproteobacteria bacterium]|nr:hypothetical protein [Deltaproteobacteria bacterium]
MAALRPATFTRFQSPERARETFRKLFSGRETATPTPFNVLMRARQLTAQNLDAFNHNPVFILSTFADFRLLGVDQVWKYVLVERISAQGNKTYELHIGSEDGSHCNMMLEKEEKAVAAGRIRFHKNTIQLNGESILMPTEFGHIQIASAHVATPSGLTVAKEILTTMLGNRVLITIEESPGFSEPEALVARITPRSPSPESFDVHGTIHLHEIFQRENILDGQKINYVLVRTATGTNQLRIDTKTRPHSIMVAEGETVLAAGKIQRAITKRGAYAFIINGDNEGYPTFEEALNAAVGYLNAQIPAMHHQAMSFMTIDFRTAHPELWRIDTAPTAGSTAHP